MDSDNISNVSSKSDDERILENKKEETLHDIKVNINELFDRQPDIFTPTSDDDNSETNIMASYNKKHKQNFTKKNKFNKSKINYPEIFTGKKSNEPVNKADIQNGIVELYDKITEAIYYSKMAFYQAEKNKKLLCDVLDELKNKREKENNNKKEKEKERGNKKDRAMGNKTNKKPYFKA